jgi:hypothetical protein
MQPRRSAPPCPRAVLEICSINQAATFPQTTRTPATQAECERMAGTKWTIRPRPACRSKPDVQDDWVQALPSLLSPFPKFNPSAPGNF